MCVAAPNLNSAQGSINSDVMLVVEVGGDGSVVHPWVSGAFQTLSCVEGAGMSACVHVLAHAWVCEIEAPGYFGPNAYVGFSMARRAPGHSGSPRHTHTHTINVLLPLWKSKLSAL